MITSPYVWDLFAMHTHVCVCKQRKMRADITYKGFSGLRGHSVQFSPHFCIYIHRPFMITDVQNDPEAP